MVERYNAVGYDPGMTATHGGSWVRHSDYADLERQIAELRAEVDVQRQSKEFAQRCCDKAEAENARLRALPLKDEVERVLEWYEDQARAAAKYLSDDKHTDAVEAIITAIALDGGNRARSLLSRLRAGEQEGWRTMDSAPGDEETPVLLWINGQWAVGLTWKRRDGSVIGKAAMFGNSTAEYWQPLPASPSVSEGGSLP